MFLKGTEIPGLAEHLLKSQGRICWINLENVRDFVNLLMYTHTQTLDICLQIPLTRRVKSFAPASYRTKIYQSSSQKPCDYTERAISTHGLR